MADTIRILGMTGSLRRGSYNMAALRAAKAMLPEGASMEIADLSVIPLLNEDEEAKGVPAAAEEFRRSVKEADALLISTPEYNYSIPPALKNALDWASRGDDAPVHGKPIAIMSASPGVLGGSRVQYHLRQMCVALDAKVLNKPEVFIGRAHKKFDDNGNLKDESTRRAIAELLSALVDFAKA
ncbi:MAG: NADPH-dependent FMN reductase [Burkholderiales bacterium]